VILRSIWGFTAHQGRLVLLAARAATRRRLWTFDSVEVRRALIFCQWPNEPLEHKARTKWSFDSFHVRYSRAHLLSRVFLNDNNQRQFSWCALCSLNIYLIGPFGCARKRVFLKAVARCTRLMGLRKHFVSKTLKIKERASMERFVLT